MKVPTDLITSYNKETDLCLHDMILSTRAHKMLQRHAMVWVKTHRVLRSSNGGGLQRSIQLGALKSHMDDILLHHASWEEHLPMIDEVLRRLQEYRLNVNPLKCEWTVNEINFLGYWITKVGTKPSEKWIGPILRMEGHATVKERKRFVRSVKRQMSIHKKCVELLTPMTDMAKVDMHASKKHWGKAHWRHTRKH